MIAGAARRSAGPFGARRGRDRRPVPWPRCVGRRVRLRTRLHRQRRAPDRDARLGGRHGCARGPYAVPPGGAGRHPLEGRTSSTASCSPGSSRRVASTTCGSSPGTCPKFDDLDADLRRIRASVGVLERRRRVRRARARHRVDRQRARWRRCATSGSVELSRRTRDLVGGMPLGAIVLEPVLLEVVNPDYWPAFPWREDPRRLRRVDADDVLDQPERQERIPRRASGTPTRTSADCGPTSAASDAAVHPVGGIADAVSPADIVGFVRAARRQDAIGWSVYDYATTTSGLWPRLRGAPVVHRRAPSPSRGGVGDPGGSAATEVDTLRRAIGDPDIRSDPVAHHARPPGERARRRPRGGARRRCAMSPPPVARATELELGPTATFLPTSPTLYLAVGGRPRRARSPAATRCSSGPFDRPSRRTSSSRT